MTTTQSVPKLSRRRLRIERELRALRAMEERLFSAELLWAIPVIPAVAAMVILIALRTHWMSGSPALTAVVAALSGLAVWWCFRRWFSLSGMMWFALYLVLPRSISDLTDMTWREDAKEVRRDKVKRAIARREAMLTVKGRAV